MKLFDRKLITILAIGLVTGAIMLRLGPQESLDARFYYTADEAKTYLQSLDHTRTGVYFFTEILDLLFLATYSAALYLCLGRLYPDRKWTTAVALLPGAFDFFETSSILYALWHSTDVGALGIVTCLKWCFAAIAVGAISFRLIQLNFRRV